MSIQDLKKLAYYLGLIDTSIDKLTRRLLIKLLRQELETTVEKSKEPEIFLNEVQEFIGKDKDYVKSETNRQAPKGSFTLEGESGERRCRAKYFFSLVYKILFTDSLY